MPTTHPIPFRPIGAILAARRREKAALASRCQAFAAIAEALARRARPHLSAQPCRWDQLGDFAGVAASADRARLRRWL